MPQDRARDQRRVVKIYNKPGFSGDNVVFPGDYKLSDNSILTSSEDEKAQLAFKAAGHNKGKAGDMVKHQYKRVEASIPSDSHASLDYEPSFRDIEKLNER